MRRIIAGLNRNRIVDKSRVSSIISRLSSDKRVLEDPKHPAIAKIDRIGAIRAQPPRIGVEEFIRFWPRRPSLRSGRRPDTDRE
jgi:hypothetical protein